ncbi:hypothetical protein [Nitratireductor luteus]|nr:hypothetical protein [Nitratireductor luteus]
MTVQTLWKNVSTFMREFAEIMDHARTGKPSPQRIRPAARRR